MAVKLIVDSGCEITAQEANALGICLVPMLVHFGDREYRAGVDMDSTQFYGLLADSDTLPTTSQPTPYDFETVYKQVTKDGSEAVVICISSTLSGTYQSACIAAQGYPDKVWVIDTQNVTIGQRILVEYALQQIDAGCTGAALAEKLEQAKKDVCVFGTVDTLEYLVKGGRLSKTAGAVGSLLGIRPLLTVKDGVLTVLSKPRGTKAANAALTKAVLEQEMDPNMPRILGYTGVDNTLLMQYQADNAQLWPENTPVVMIGGTIGTHTGPGLIAVGFFRKH